MASQKGIFLTGLILVALVAGFALLRPRERLEEHPDDAVGRSSGFGRPALQGARSSVDLPPSREPATEAVRTVKVRVVFELLPRSMETTRRAYVGLGPTGTRDRSSEVWQWVDEGAAVVFEVPVAGPIRVSCAAAPWAVDGAVPEIPVAQDDVTIRLVAACDITIEVLDKSSGLRVRGDMGIVLENLATGVRVATASSREDMLSTLSPPRLPMGTYGLTVTAPGYRPWTASEIRLGYPGALRAMTALLSPEPTAGRIVLDLDPPPGGSLKGAWIHAEVMRRGIKDAVWRTLLPSTLDEASHSATLTPLAPGDYRVLVWAGRDLVGIVEDVTIHAGQTAHARLRLKRGLLVPLADLPWKPAFYSDSRSIEVSTRGGTPLPLLYFASRQSALGRREWFFSKHDHRDEQPRRPTRAASGLMRGLVQHDAVLGPYPYDAAVVREAAVLVREAEGSAKREHVFTVE